MATTAAPDAVIGAVSVAVDSVTIELAAVLARLGELTDAVASDPTVDHTAADAARIDQVALLERIQAARATAASPAGSGCPLARPTPRPVRLVPLDLDTVTTSSLWSGRWSR